MHVKLFPLRFNHLDFLCVANLKICLVLFIAAEQYNAGLLMED